MDLQTHVCCTMTIVNTLLLPTFSFATCIFLLEYILILNNLRRGGEFSRFNVNFQSHDNCN